MNILMLKDYSAVWESNKNPHIGLGRVIQSNYNSIFRLFLLCSLSLLISACAVQPSQQIPAFLPMADNVPRSEPTDIDGIWRVSTIGKNIRIEGGRAYAIDGWLHLFTLKIEPGMVVIRNITQDGVGGYSGEDLPLMGKWQAKRAANGTLDVFVAGTFGPVNYQLIPVSLDDSGDYSEDDDYYDPGDSEDQQPPQLDDPFPPTHLPGDGAHWVGNKLTEIGMNCYKDNKPMANAMIKYGACQAGLGNFNALKKALKAKKVSHVNAVFNASACRNEFNRLLTTVRRKGFKSISLGISGELAAIIGGSGEAFLATNLDLSKSTFYGSLGAGVGTQVGGSVNGVVSAFLSHADRLSGKGKSFSVSLKAFGGAGGAVGLSSGSSPTCESFSAIAGAGAAVNAGSISSTRTFKLIRIPKPDFTPSCKNVSVKAFNRTGAEIKIVDVDFYDYENKRWRSKVVKNKVIAKGESWSKKLRLQKVGGDKTKVRIQYRIKTGRGLFKKWSKVKNQASPTKTCQPGTSFSTELL